ncbi:sterigmatocystin 8-O-methyltransferase [Xylaria sp. FL1042]|nr:sterigmatocystin 8-O-methyltransferase [Xylaria sp. FL1042]
MATPAASRLVQLAATIHERTSALEKSLQEHGVPSPSFDEDAPTLLPKDTIETRDAIIDCAAEIQDLLQGPLDLMFRHGSFNNCVSLQAITRLKIANLVPSGGQSTYAAVAKGTGLAEREVRRLLRHAMTMRVFRETETGALAHTQASRALLDPVANDWVGLGTEETWSASTRMVDALQKWPGTQEPHETGFTLANGGERSIYKILEVDPRRALRFANGMKAYMLMQEYNSSHVLNNYDWAGLGKVHIVDVGGGAGHVSAELITRFPNISATVQDMENMFEGADARIPAELGGRLKYMVHDFFTPQPVKTDVYFLRWVFHNWSDKYCALIIKALIPALRPGARIIVNETCMPEPGAISHWREKYLRAFDLSMGTTFASYERSLDEWKALFADVDQRFKFQSVNDATDSALALIEFVWFSEK